MPRFHGAHEFAGAKEESERRNAAKTPPGGLFLLTLGPIPAIIENLDRLKG